MTDKAKIEAVGKPEPSSARLITTLGIAGLMAGILLAGVNLYTRPMIKENRAMALQNAIFKVLPGCVEYVPLVMQQGELVELISEGIDEEISPTIFAGYDSTNVLLGIAVVGEEPGFQDIISGIFGYNPTEKLIVGFEVLESKETPGLGDKIIKDPAFRENFTALAVEPRITTVKEGQKNNPHEVEMITGATISSRTVVKLINKALGTTKEAMEEFATSKQESDGGE